MKLWSYRRKYIFPIIQKKKKEEAEKKEHRIPLYKQPPVEIEPSKEDEPIDIDGDNTIVDFNINDPKNIVNNLKL